MTTDESESRPPVRQPRPAALAAWVALLAAIALLSRPGALGADPYELVAVGDGFKHPVQLTHAGDGSGRTFVVEQEGRVLVMRDGRPAETFLDLRSKVYHGGECGLLSIAFHPKFRENGRCFVNYTSAERGLDSIVSELTVPKGGQKAEPASEREILRLAQPYPNHNGGMQLFGPDGFLYIGFGDGGAGGDPHGHGQNLSSLLGKMLRIDVDTRAPGLAYGIPADNPFVGTPGARPEIWAYGLRNPWRFSFDPATGTLWCADVGQNRFEEIDVIERGKNYGWNVMEGAHCFKPESGCNTQGLTLPAKEYGRKKGVCVTGGHVYRGKAVPDLAGAYIYGDFGSGRIWSLRLSGGWVKEDRELMHSKKPISSFGTDEAGELYVVTYEGRVWQLKKSSE